jgi:endonuclease/exonuclease/phosphatase family metal-dependent hydrolase
MRTAFVVLILFVVCSNVRAELPKEIRVLTHNIHHGEGVDGRTDLKRIALVLSAAKPDIVALQAVDEKTQRSEGVDQAQALAKLTGMKAYFSRAMDFDDGGYGNAVLSNLPVRSQETVKLPTFQNVSPQRAEPRVVQVLELGEKGEPGLLLLCTHLDYRQDRDGTDGRYASAQAINALIGKYIDMPAILVGNLNAAPKQRSIREFAKEWRIAGLDREGMQPQAEGEGENKKLRILHSYPAQRPRWWIDYVMCRPAERWHVVEARVLEEPLASVHRPVLAVLRRVDKDELGE